MVRILLSCLMMIGMVSLASADDTKAKSNDTKNPATRVEKGHRATITKVDAKNHTITVKMKDKNGKDKEKTFKLTEDIRYVDSNGQVAAIDVFRSGDTV